MLVPSTSTSTRVLVLIHSFISDRDDLRSESQDDLMARIVELEKVIATNLGKPPAMTDEEDGEVGDDKDADNGEKEQGGRSSPDDDDGDDGGEKEQGGRSSPESTVSFRKAKNAMETHDLGKVEEKREELTDEQKQESQGCPRKNGLRPQHATVLRPAGLAHDLSEVDHLQADACYEQQDPRLPTTVPCRPRLDCVGSGIILPIVQAEGI